MGVAGPARQALLGVLLGCAAAMPGTVLAQAVGSPPTREQVEPPAPTTTGPSSTVKVDSNQTVQATSCPLSRYDLEVTIGSIKFTGPGGSDVPAELTPLLAPIAAAPPAGKQKIAVVCDIRDRATEALRRKGYVASVQIPPQRIESGELRLEVVTARITEIRVRGEAGGYEKTLASRIAQLKALRPLNERDAERILLTANDIPGLDVQLALRPAGTAPGDVIGDLTVSSHRFAVLANIQNYGSRQLGRQTGYLRGEYYGLTGDSLTYVGGQLTAQTKEQKVVQAGHLMGIGNRGMTIALSGTYAWSRPDISGLDLRSESLIAGLKLTVPLVRALRRDVRVIPGFEFIEQRTRFFDDTGSSPLNRDKIRVATLRVEGDMSKPISDGGVYYSLSAAAELRKGLGIFGATKINDTHGGYFPTRVDGDAKATVIKGDLDAVIGVGPIFSIAGSARGQWSNHPLLNFEEFSIGNLTIGRGYDPGANSADRAVGLSGEARAKVYDNGQVRADLFGFYDSVWIWNIERGAIETDRRLGSYGGGVRMTLQPYAYLEAYYAHPTDKALISVPNAKTATDRFLMSLTVKFAPGS